MAQVYNLKLRYNYGGVSAVNTELCRIELIGESLEGAKIFLYRFEDALVFGKTFDWNEPVLKVEEYRNTAGEVTHLIFTIISWDGLESGLIVWGTNEFPIWQEAEIEYPLSLNTGKQKAISINQIQNPIITEVTPPEPSWWSKLSTLSQGMLIGGSLLVLGLLFWKVRK